MPTALRYLHPYMLFSTQGTDVFYSCISAAEQLKSQGPIHGLGRSSLTKGYIHPTEHLQKAD